MRGKLIGLIGIFSATVLALGLGLEAGSSTHTPQNRYDTVADNQGPTSVEP